MFSLENTKNCFYSVVTKHSNRKMNWNIIIHYFCSIKIFFLVIFLLYYHFHYNVFCQQPVCCSFFLYASHINVNYALE